MLYRFLNLEFTEENLFQQAPRRFGQPHKCWAAFFKYLYSRVHISSDEVFSKILKEPSPSILQIFWKVVTSLSSRPHKRPQSDNPYQLCPTPSKVKDGSLRQLLIDYILRHFRKPDVWFSQCVYLSLDSMKIERILSFDRHNTSKKTYTPYVLWTTNR